VICLRAPLRIMALRQQAHIVLLKSNFSHCLILQHIDISLRHSAEKTFRRNVIKQTIKSMKTKVLNLPLALTLTQNLTLILTLTLFYEFTFEKSFLRIGLLPLFAPIANIIVFLICVQFKSKLIYRYCVYII